MAVGKMATEEGVGKLEEAALKRKERLQALREKRKGNQNESITDQNDNDENKEALPRPVFRSYQPLDESLKENTLEKAKPESVEKEIRDHLEAAKPEPLINEVDLASLAPRKPDWDLKRDVEKKLEKLEKRTQKAVAELIRERLKAGEENIADAVNTVSNAATHGADSDED